MTTAIPTRTTTGTHTDAAVIGAPRSITALLSSMK
jgi:hypothetical protein